MNRRDLLRGVTSIAATVSAADIAEARRRKPVSPPPGEVWQWTAVDVAAAIRDRHISSREATESCLARLESVNPKINAVVEVFAEEALAAADAADRAIRNRGAIGPLHGVPITTKITSDQRGHATSSGAVAFRNAIAKDDSAAIGNLRRAGAVIVGRSNAPPFATRWFTDNDLFGRTLNPWNSGVTPGGSSGGAAASIAAGMTPLAQCGDTIGSIRIPAYACGVAGLRPTRGRVPTVNPSAAARARGISIQLVEVSGLIARKIGDLRLGLSVLSEGDFRDVWWIPAKTFEKPRGPVKVALFDKADGIAVDPAVAAGLRSAAASLSRAGYIVEQAAPPFFAEMRQLLFDILFNDVRSDFFPLVDKFGDAKSKQAMASFWGLTRPLDLPGFSAAMGRREQILVAWKAFLQTYPIILMPPCWARPFLQDFDLQGSAQFAAMIDALSPTFCASLLGLPAVAVPAGVIDGLPTGVEIIADQFREDLCFDAGEAIEAAIPMPTPIDPRT